jgi:hypothetical protein
MTISTVAIATGAAEPLIRWSGAEFMYPVLAQMPAGYWDRVRTRDAVRLRPHPDG